MRGTTNAYYTKTMDEKPYRHMSKHKDSQFQGTKAFRSSKCSEVRHQRRAYHNSQTDFDATYKSDLMWIEDLLVGLYRVGTSRT